MLSAFRTQAVTARGFSVLIHFLDNYTEVKRRALQNTGIYSQRRGGTSIMSRGTLSKSSDVTVQLSGSAWLAWGLVVLDGDISFFHFQDVDYKTAALVSGPEAQPLPLPCRQHCWHSKDIRSICSLLSLFFFLFIVDSFFSLKVTFDHTYDHPRMTMRCHISEIPICRTTSSNYNEWALLFPGGCCVYTAVLLMMLKKSGASYI